MDHPGALAMLAAAGATAMVVMVREWYIRHSLSGRVVLREVGVKHRVDLGGQEEKLVEARKVGEAVARLRAYASEGISFEARRATLAGLAAFLEGERGAIVEALRADLGRPEFESYVYDVYNPLNEVLTLLKNLSALTSWKRAPYDWTLTSFPSDGAYLAPEPYGAALVVGSWNFPIMLSIVPLAGAVAAGNAVLLKPPYSGRSAATASLLAERLPRYLPEDAAVKIVAPPATLAESAVHNTEDDEKDDDGLLQTKGRHSKAWFASLREADIEAMNACLETRFDVIFFTGSPGVGKIVAKKAAEHMTPCVLECGGKNPTFVAADADLKLAAKRIVWGRLLNAGQQCIAPDYVLCEKTVADAFADECAACVADHLGNDPRVSKDFGRMAAPQDAERLGEWLSDEKNSRGVSVVCGGAVDPPNRYVAPTVLLLDPATCDGPWLSEEIFGPVLPILPVPDLDAAVASVNSRPKPLASYVFSSSRQTATSFLLRTSAGGATVNDCIFHAAHPHLPFGGVGTSGYGAYHGDATFRAFAHVKPILVKNSGFLGKYAVFFVYPPWSRFKINLITAVMAPKFLFSTSSTTTSS